MEKGERKLLGIIDVFSAGFGLMARRPWILLIPIALDLCVWLGPQIGAQPLFDQARALLGLSPLPDTSAETLQTYEMMQRGLQALGEEVNVLGVLSLGLVPTLFGVRPPASAWTRPVWLVLPDGKGFLLAMLPLAFVGLFIASIYLELIARALRHDSGSVVDLARRVLRSYWTLTALAIFLTVMFGGLVIVVAFGVALVSMLSMGLASFIFLGGLMLVLWATLYLAFAIPSIFVSGTRAPQAVFNSINVFRSNFWHAIGFLFLAYIIQMGFAIIWQGFLETLWGAILAVIANAFLSSGLVAAGMVFYHDRITWLQTLAAKPAAPGRPDRQGK